jgi:hypothetical protein
LPRCRLIEFNVEPNQMKKSTFATNAIIASMSSNVSL